MPWKFQFPANLIGGAQVQQTSEGQQETPMPSWYPPSVVGSSSSSRPSISRTYSPGIGTSGGLPPPAEAAGVIAHLKDKSIDELRKLLTDKNAYETFFNSLEQVKVQSNVRDELRKETLQLARENLDKEPHIMELRNQCRVIRTTELAAAQEKLSELEKQKEELLRFYSPSSLLQKLEDAMNAVDDESEMVCRQFLRKEIDLATFMQKYKSLRTIYHRRALLHRAAKSSPL